VVWCFSICAVFIHAYKKVFDEMLVRNEFANLIISLLYCYHILSSPHDITHHGPTAHSTTLYLWEVIVYAQCFHISMGKK